MASMIRAQFLTRIPQTPPKSLKDQVAVIIGGNTGLGLETGRQLLGLGLSRLIIATKSEKRGKDAVDSFRSINKDANIDVWALEMESYDSVRAFARRCEDLARLDIVILNAGLAKQKFSRAGSAHETTLQVNYYSTLLLAILLLPTLRRAAPGKLTIVSSGTSNQAIFPTQHARPVLASLDKVADSFDAFDQYAISKLLGQIFLNRLTQYISPGDVVINMVELGLTNSGLFREAEGLIGLLYKIIGPLVGRHPAVAARTFVDAAVVKGASSHGCLVELTNIGPSVQQSSEKNTC